ncbi:hypothetical protein AHF37_07484 [Paragonimus kellicotti]|nr:hypothetical protein AHF37_07484 [Paragonimus kellicotti]
MKFEETMAIQCLLVGVQDTKIRERLLSEEESKLNWDRACSIARQRENITEQLILYQPSSAPDTVQLITRNTSPLKSAKNPTRTFTCYRCGEKHEAVTDCRHKQSTCHSCGKIGHIARVCRSKQAQSSDFRPKTRAVRSIEDHEESVSYLISHTSATLPTGVPPYLNIEARNVCLEIDTGASVTLINRRILPKSLPLVPAAATLRSYTGDAIDVMGTCNVEVKYGTKTLNLPAYIVNNESPNLLGRNWLKLMPDLFLSIRRVDSHNSLPVLLQKFSSVFDENELGRLKDFQATIVMEQDAPAKFYKARIDALQDNLERLYQQDFIDAGPVKGKEMSVDDRQAIGLMGTSIRLTDDHYEVALPWHPGSFLSLDNRPIALKRLHMLRQRLMKCGNLAQHYSHVMGEYISRGHAELVPKDGTASCRWYLPHHPVFHPAKPQKLRIVFDCAAKYAGKSLNDHLLSGPDLTNSLVGVLLRFRQEKIAVMADIEAMFHQVRVPDKDRDALRFLWWTNTEMQGSPTEYRMCVHLFGAASSPSCATFALRKTISDNADHYDANILRIAKRSFYVDDCLFSTTTVDNARDSANQLKDPIGERRFQPHEVDK